MTTNDKRGIVTTSINNSIATIEFGHPQSNCLPIDLMHHLSKEIQNLSSNESVSVIVLKSSGDKVFCAGASFDELLAVSNIEEATYFFSGFAQVLNAMRSSSKIFIGRIQGKVVGGGLGIVAACDYALATTESDIKLSELSIGIGPFVIEPAVSRKIGKNAMTELTLETQWKSALWANQKGLYNSIFDNINELDNELEVFSTKLSKFNPEALEEMKKVFWEGTENWADLLYERAEISGKLVLSDFSKTTLNQLKS